MKPAVILVGADKGGVGKTTIARALLDYIASHNQLARAFDTESPRGTLQRFHPNSMVVDVTQTADQMKIIDTLNGSEVKVSVIDARAGSMATTLVALKNMGFLDAVKEGQFTFTVFHVLGSSIASLDEISTVAPYVEDANYFLVKNFINDTTFFQWDQATYDSYFKQVRSAGEITIPKLNELAYERVEVAGVKFTDFVDNKTAEGEAATHSFVLRGYVRTWMRDIAAEFDRIKLLDLLSPPKTVRR